ncbi:hypothetical protein K9M41_01035 [Candidatus Gracilibacteria bacterium]|nr:hypothetical protein [Candidatus Gracilibacteria bacterium]
MSFLYSGRRLFGDIKYEGNMKKKSRQQKVWIAVVRLSWVFLFALVEIFFFDSSLLDATVQSQLPTTVPDFDSLKMTLEISVVLMGVMFEFFRFALLQKQLQRNKRKRKIVLRTIVIKRAVRAY